MPNWCLNKVTLSGHPSIIHDIFHYINTYSGVAVFQKFVPTGDSIDEHYTSWGTKWDVDTDEISVCMLDDNTMTMEFHTAWSPPIPFFQSLVNRYSGLQVVLEYAEPGMAFIGKWDSAVSTDGYEWSMEDSDVPKDLKETFSELYETN